MTKEKITQKCSVENCERKHLSRGYCAPHYHLLWKKAQPSKGICIVETCEEPIIIRQLCNKHYKRLNRTGTVECRQFWKDIGKTVEEQFWARVDKTLGLGPDGDCWEWIAGLTDGYGMVCINGKNQGAHRVSWEWATGQTTDLFILHSCDNRACVNPEHLHPGTAKDNTLEMLLRHRNTRVMEHDTVRHIRDLAKQGYRTCDIVRLTKVSRECVDFVIKGKTFQWLE